MKYEELNATDIAEQAKLPKVIKFSEDGEDIPISHPAIQDIIKAAASIERKKLYSSMNNLQNQNEELSQKLAIAVANPVSNPSVQQVTSTSIEAGQNPETALQNQNKAIKATMENEKNKPVTREDVSNMLAEAFNKTLPEVLRNHLAPVAETISNIQKQTIEEYRNARIAELGDTIIPELVEGNTKDEIETSIIKSRTLRARYPASTPATETTTHTETPVQTSTQHLAPQTVQVPAAVTVQAPATPIPAVPPATPSVNDKNLPDFSKMSSEEFGKSREALGKALREQYGQ